MRKIILITFLGFSILNCYSQSISPQLVSTSGDSYSNANYQLSWSVGEVVTETCSDTQITINQGFHQGNYTVTSVNDNLLLKYNITVYPNPTSDFLRLKVENYMEEGLEYVVSDLNGKKLYIKEVKSETEEINFSQYPEGAYLISILKNNNQVKSFQIIKN